MRKQLAVCAAFFCYFLLLGAVPPAPVIQTTDFYVNDYAAVMAGPHHADILALSTALYQQTGVQVVVLTVGSFGGLTPDEYGKAIIYGWEIGGPHGQNGALILIGVDNKQAQVFIGDGLAPSVRDSLAGIEFNSRNLSKGVMDYYRPLVLAIYESHGITPDEATLAKLTPAGQSASSPFGTGTVIFLAVIVLAVGRSFRVSRKYRSKYLKGHVRKVKTYARTHNDEDEYENEKIYRIDHDGMD